MQQFRELVTEINYKAPPPQYGIKLFSRQVYPAMILAPSSPKMNLNLMMNVGSGKSFCGSYIANLFFNYLEPHQEIWVVTVLSNINDFIDSLAQIYFSPMNYREYKQKIIDRISNPSLPDPRKAFRNGNLSKRVFFNSIQKMEQKCFGMISKAEVNKEKLPSLHIKEDVIKKLTNSLLVIDEFQMCYSMEGWNTYGGTVKKMLEEIPGLKLLTLSGTFFNSNPLEYMDMMDILGIEKKTRDDFPDMLTYDESKQDININKKMYQEFLDHVDKTSVNLFSYYMPKEKKNMPELRIIGETLSKKTKIKFSKIKLTKPQEKTLETYGSNENIYEIVVPSTTGYSYKYDQILTDYQKNKEWYHEKGIAYDHSNTKLLVGDFFMKREEDNIFNYSCILQKILSILMEKRKDRPLKKLFYTENINELNGIKQYEYILKQNGFVSYEDQVIGPKSICLKCHKTYSDHNNQKHNFKPYIFSLLTGEIQQNKRDKIRSIFNSPENLHGELINFLFISAVANVAITFQAVGLLCIISVIPNISLLQQIIGRVVRTNSHALLPEEKRFVEIEILLATHSSGILTNEENNYIKKELFFNLIDDVNQIIAKNSIDCQINHGTNCTNKEIQIPIAYNILNIEIKKTIKWLFRNRIILMEHEIIELIKENKENLISWNVSKYPDDLIKKALEDITTVYSTKYINIDNFKNDKIYEDEDFLFRIIHIPQGPYVRIPKDQTKSSLHIIEAFNKYSTMSNLSQMLIDNYLNEIVNTNIYETIVLEITNNKNLTYLKIIFNDYITDEFGVIDKIILDSITYYRWLIKKNDKEVPEIIIPIYSKIINYMSQNNSLLYNDMEPALTLYPITMESYVPLILKPFNIKPKLETYTMWKKIVYLEKLLQSQLPPETDITGFTLGNAIFDLDKKIYKIVSYMNEMEGEYLMKYNINNSRIGISYRGYFSISIKNTDVSDNRYKKTGRNLLYFDQAELSDMYKYLESLYITIYKTILSDNQYKKYMINKKEKKNMVSIIEMMFYVIQILKETFNMSDIPTVYISPDIQKHE